MLRNEKVSAEKVAQCEARAQRIVETLLDPVTDEDEFLSQLRWVNPDHYQYITEERAIQKTCGYPLCEEKLVKIPTKKYQICTQKNKVNQCYKASNYLKQQLPTSPLWVREQEEKPEFILLRNSTELMGEEISFGIERVSLSRSESISNLKETNESKMVESKPDHNHSAATVSTNCSTIGSIVEHNPSSDNSLCHDVKATSLPNCTLTKLHSRSCSDSISDEHVNQLTSSNSKIHVESRCDNQFDEIHLSRQLTPVNLTPNENNPSFTGGDTTANSTQNHPKNDFLKISNKYNDNSQSSKTRISNSSIVDKNMTSSSNFVLRVEKSLGEWCTVDTLTFILGVENVKRMMLEKGRIFETREQVKCDTYIFERYEAIFKKLKILEMEKEKCTSEAKLFEKPTRPLPDFATLKKQTQEMEIKVRAFYRGDKKVTFDENKNEKDENGISVVLPSLHQHTKMAVRRNAVLDRLKKTLPDLATILGLRIIDLNEKIKQLALTCKFAAHNITFKPVEWNLICLIFIKLLSIRDTDLQKYLHEKANYVNAMLMSYQLENNYLDLICTWLMDLDRILENDEEPC